MSASNPQGKSSVAFKKAAIAFDVHESDYLGLLSDNVSTYESMGFRLGEREDFELYLRKTVMLRAAYRDDKGEIVVFNRPKTPSWDNFRSSEDAGCLRKLWTLSHQVSKKEVEALATGADEDQKNKITMATAQELEEEAVRAGGIPSPGSDRERPSLHTLGRLQSNFGPNGAYMHLSWEVYVDLDYEGRLRRQGRLPKDKTEIFIKDDNLKMGTKQGVDFGYTDVKDITVLREIMEIRGRAMHMLKILDYETHTRLVNRYVSLLRVTPAEGFRRPTVNELRKTDRNLFEEILSWVAKGYGTLQAGITYHLDDRESWVWKLMHQQPESTPDQGVEKTLEDKSKKRRRDISSEDEDRRVSHDHKNDRRGGGRDDPPQPRYCLVCGKRHEPRCELTPGLRKELRAKSKARKEKAKQFKKKAEDEKKKNK